MRALIFLLVALLLSPTFAKTKKTDNADADTPGKLKPFDRKIYVVGVGQARVVYKIPGEPMKNPARLEVYISCGKSKKERLLKSMMICDLEDYHYDASAKTLVAKLIIGRVEEDTGQSFCDNTDEEDIGLDVCDN